MEVGAERIRIRKEIKVTKLTFGLAPIDINGARKDLMKQQHLMKQQPNLLTLGTKRRK